MVDIPFGLCILKCMAEILNIPTPRINFYIEWHQQFMGKDYLVDGRLNQGAIVKETGAPYAYGIRNVYDLVKGSLPSSSRL